MITEIAPAKINLYLHVGATREDGLHDLASLFVFAEGGDVITASPSSDLSLDIFGQFADVLESEPVASNLVWKAAEMLRQAFQIEKGASLALDKRLPVAAGIGGGSADAAAAIRALVKLWEIEASSAELAHLAFQLGADVPACISRAPLNVTGAGEIIQPGPALPPLWVCLVNPMIAMPTGPIFQAFDRANPSPTAPEINDTFEMSDLDAVSAFMRATRNDLEPFARSLAPEIGKTIELLHECSGNIAARMSGSGATTFGLFKSSGAAQEAAAKAQKQSWWAMSSQLCRSAE